MTCEESDYTLCRLDAADWSVYMEQKIYLTLQTGQVFEGKAFGADIETTGELVFATAMTGYLETLTDPSYFGQIVLQTFPLIGNYGVIPSDFESSKVHLKAYIVKNWCQEPSNFRCEGDLDTFLKEQGIPGMFGIDTRAITKIVREHGVMNARLSKEPLSQKEVDELSGYRVEKAVATMSCKQRTDLPAIPPESQKYRVVLWDFGAKGNIPRELQKRGCEVLVLPYNTTADDIKDLNPDGIMLSNGPGDPAENVGVIKELTELCRAKIPTFGICLGHQLLALSQGAKTEKLKYGHRGANQPAREVPGERVYITSQNHGYAVVADTLPPNARESFCNANDGTNEGVSYTDMPAFSVQFHPEACGGPLDTGFLFDRFIQSMNDNAR